MSKNKEKEFKQVEKLSKDRLSEVCLQLNLQSMRKGTKKGLSKEFKVVLQEEVRKA